MFYIAGKYTAKERLRRERAQLRRMGFSVSASWLDESYEEDADATDEVKQANADRDLQEVWKANAFILDTLDESVTGGREVELGAALTGYKTFYLVGPPRNIFHYAPDFKFDSWAELYAHLEELS